MAWKCIGVVPISFLKTIPRGAYVNVRKKSAWAVGRDNAFGKYLILTNTISSGFLMAMGDLIQQQIEYVKNNQHVDSYDWRRNSKYLFLCT